MSHVLWQNIHFGRLSQLDKSNNLHQVGWCLQWVWVIIISPDTLICVQGRNKQIYFPTRDFARWLCSTATVQIWLCLGEPHHTDEEGTL